MNTQLGKMSLLLLAWVGFATVSSGQIVTCTNSGVPVTINTGADTWNGEVGWELYNVTTGEIVAYEQTGGALDENISVTFDAPVGDYELYGFDSFGDNWSGFTVEVESNGQVLCFGDDVSGGPGDGGVNATATCGGGTNGGTLLCAQFSVLQPACTIDCPPVTFLNNDAGECGAFVSIPVPDLGADCEGDPVNDYNGTADASDFYPVGTTVVTFSASDASGTIADCSFAVIVSDAEEPTFANCPNDLTINLDAGECDQVYSFQLDVEDNCPPTASNIEGPYCDPCQDPTGASALACAPFAENSIIQFIDLPGGGDIEFLTFNQETFGDEPLATFNIYEQQPGGVVPYTGGGFTPLGSVQYQTDAADNGECVEVDFPNPVTIPAGGVWLEVYTPGNTVNSRIVQTPETCDGNAGTGNLTYINAPACGFNPPVTFASQGFTLDAGFTLGYNSGELEAEPDANPTNPDANQFASGDLLPIGEHCFEYEAEDAAGNIATCEWCVTVAEFPNPVQNLACNDLVNVTVDEECGGIVTADMVLEGGPYGCYRDYIVEIANDMAFNDIISSSEPGDEGAIIGSAEVGGSYFVRVIDPETGNSCWGRLVVEDKLIPELECSRFPADCGADITPGAGGSSSLVLEDANGEIVIDPFAPGDYPATAEANGIVGDAQITNVSVRLVTDHTWVGDLSGNIESPSGTIVNLFPQPGGGGCGGDGLDVLFDDSAPNSNADFVNTCNNNPAIEGEYQPLDPFAALNGQNPAGEWTITINDAAIFDGGEFSVAEFIIDYNYSIPFPFDFTGTPILIDENTYQVSGFDPCGDVTASYEDEVVEISDCDSELSSRVFRNWTVVDGSGNTVTCQDTIEIIRSSLEDITFPPNFDGIDQPALACDGGNWDLNGNGYPDPEETGAPDAQICDNLLTTSKDHVIEVCEGTFKILRDWTFIDWCTSETVEFQQLIKVEDVEGPEVVCPPTATISTGANSCIATYSVPDITGNILDECSPSDVSWTVESSAGEVVDFGNQVFQIINLPIGTHTLTYTAFDGCGNEGSCEQTIIVRDEIPPVAVCDQNTKVALGVDGTARVFWPTFEDGSYDNCGIDRIEVQRMDRESDCEPNTFLFKEFVEFCCADLDRNPVQVLFRVTDEAGNQNTCMIVAPRDLTLSCNYPFDLWNLEEFGEVANLSAGEVRQTRQVFDEEYERNCLNNNQYDPQVPTYEFTDGFAQDNCSLEISSDYNDQRDDCGIGTLIRTFRAVDADGNANVAFQSIEFERCTPFTENSITWPLDQELECDENGDYSTDPEATGEPIFDDVCSQIAVRFDDEVFEVTPDACFKILRHWTVLDWCQFDEETGAGKFTYTQVIKVNDSQAPELLACDDVTFCDSSAVGCQGFANLVQEVEDCTPDSFLNVTYRVKPFNAGNNPNDDIVGSGLDASGLYPFGTHRITWIVEDMCGNVGTCQYLFTVEDCKLPTPVVINGLATVVMPSSGCIDVNVDLFDVGSFDNCGPVQISYSADVEDTITTFCCEDGLGTKEVEFWATDAVGNQDFVITSIRIQDPNGVCGNNSQPTISGTVESSAHPDKGVERAEMKLENMSAPTPIFRKTSAEGEYAFYATEGESYSLNVSKNDDVLNGVSTFDILMIQKHILGLEVLSDPYQLIAANVNDDARVSGADIIDLRKAILGIETSFPNNQSWRFVDAAETLEEGQLPRQYKESIAIYDLNEDLTDQDFVGVKIGDINGDAKPNNFTSDDAEGRNGVLAWEAEDAILEPGQTHELMITSAMFENVTGYQMTWNTNGIEIVDVISGSVRVESSNYAVFDEYMTMSWHNADGLSADENEVL
ncbi:MAG: HYR domain-containing protein, partial [Bacteroidetes bacterium]|nr:HYR domain-containing protein [Bacteroidota bacterium]